MYIPSSLWTWLFMIVAIVQAILALVFECYVFARFQLDLKEGAGNMSETRTVPTYLSIYIFSFLYQLALIYDALRLKNTIQIIGLLIFNGCLLIYAAIQIGQIREAVSELVAVNMINPRFWGDVQPYLIAVPCIFAIGTMILSGISWKLYQEFAWTIYKHISADLRLKRRYLVYQIYITLLKFDFFFFLGFTVQFIVIITNRDDVEFYLTIAAVPITIVLLLLAAYWVRRESVVGMAVIIVIYFGALAYFLFKLVRMYNDESRQALYRPGRRVLTSFAIITLIILVATIINAIWCTRNFNKGLKEHIHGIKKNVSHDDKADTTEMPVLAGPAPNRMTID